MSHEVRFTGVGPVGMLMSSRSEESPIGSPHSSASASPSNEVRRGGMIEDYGSRYGSRVSIDNWRLR